MVDLKLKEGFSPIFLACRRVSFEWKKEINEELDKWVNDGIIFPVEYSEWATPLVPVKKSNGKLRLCADFRVTLNKWVVEVKYPLPRIEEIMENLKGAKYFSKVDFSSAYLQFLKEEIRKLLTITTPKGLFAFCRLPFGLSVSASIFQRTMASVFQGLEGVFYYMDDVLITGVTPEQHNQRLEEVFKRKQDKGLKASKEKSVNFEWKIEQRNAFENLKRKIGEEPILVCFNNDLEIILAVDASNKSVGGALLHVIDGLERPIIFFSRIFHEVETRYSVIEQEALAIIFELTKCREYLIGKRFVIYTDHKPLIHLFKKDNKELMMSPRCFRCQSFGHQIKDCNIPTHVLQNREREDHLSETDEVTGTSYFCGKNNRVQSEVAYQNYNKINEIESRFKPYGNRQWPPISYDGTIKRTNIIQDRTGGITSMGNLYYGKIQDKNDNSIKMRSNIVKVTNNADVQRRIDVMDTKEEEILKDREEDI
ncbi:uncharacterized protein LOC135926829 [Gordionus sp. m RMFG-2023]|uniref:uncharacterized protein LOC135926829 n=1 Tax=Gordionus sp. m RMFG-2023 TaxID=3053472 RepID=UPI0031FCC127